MTKKTTPAKIEAIPREHATTPDAAGWKFSTSAKFDRIQHDKEWLIRSILLPSQPAVIGGTLKSLKTSLAVDLAISLGTGKKFLGHFEVPAGKRVMMICGESAEGVLQETARRIALSKRVEIGKADVLWSSVLPQFRSKPDLARLHLTLKQNAVDVVILDPLYLCLFAGGDSPSNGSNLFEVGPLLHDASAACLTAGATPVFVHHTTKAFANYRSQSVFGLNDLAFAGIAEFARQWLLVRSKEKYQRGSGEHDLVLEAEGCAGHYGAWDVKVQQGVLDANLAGRHWQVHVADTERGDTRKNAPGSAVAPVAKRKPGGRAKKENPGGTYEGIE